MNDNSHKSPNNPRYFSNQRGVVAIIILFLIAIAFILFAVTLNWGKIAQTKTLVTIASNTAASQGASSLASYGEYIVQTILGGRKEKCGWTEIWKIFLTIIVIIIVIIIIIVTWGAGIGLALAIIGLVLAIVALIIQAAVIQPGLTEMWNKQIQDTLTIEGQFTENSIRQALSIAATDNKPVADYYDLDVDRIYDDRNTPEVEDFINRFGFYYQKRLDSAGAIGDNVVDVFIQEFKKFLYGHPTFPNWRYGISKKVDCSQAADSAGNVGPVKHICCPDPEFPDKPIPPECNPCCVPLMVQDPSSAEAELSRFRPRACPGTEAGPAVPQCVNGPYVPYPNEYPYVYEPYNAQYYKITGHQPQQPIYDRNDPGIPNEAISLIQDRSFLERLGRDDENRRFQKQRNNPDGNQIIVNPAGYRMEDAFGYWGPPVYPILNSTGAVVNDPAQGNIPMTRTDFKRGVFPFLYKIKDWKFGISQIRNRGGGASGTGGPNSAGCIWCSTKNSPGGPDQEICQGTVDPELRLAVGQLDLPNDCGGSNCCAGFHASNPLNLGSSNPGDTDPRATDLIPDIAGVVATAADNNLCLSGPNQNLGGVGVWRPGADRFCTTPEPAGGGTTWPYHGECARNGHCKKIVTNYLGDPEKQYTYEINRGCVCGEIDREFDVIESDDSVTHIKIDVSDENPPAPPPNWPEDVLDEAVYGFPEVLKIAASVFSQSQFTLRKSATIWYPSIAELIEPKEDYTNLESDGILIRIRDGLARINAPVERWLAGRDPDGDGDLSDSYTGATCNSTWCVPPADSDLVTPGNQSCPQVSTVEEDSFWSDNQGGRAGGTRGNMEGVLNCLEWNANNWDISVLPQPPPGPNCPRGYTGDRACPYRGNADKFDLCARQCSTENCSNLPRSLYPRPAGAPVWPPPFIPDDGSDKLDACQNSQTFEECNVNCAPDAAHLPAGTFGPGTPYNLPSFDPVNTNRLNPNGIYFLDENRGATYPTFYDLCFDANPGNDTMARDCGSYGANFSLDCSNLLLSDSWVDVAINTGILGSCGPWEEDHFSATENFYETVTRLLNPDPEICGVGWGLGNQFWENVAIARGSCNGDVQPFNTYLNSLDIAWQQAINNLDGQAVFEINRCRSACSLANCANLYSAAVRNPTIAVQYNIERPFRPGIAVAGQDVNDIRQFNECLGANGNACPTECVGLPQVRQTNTAVSYNINPNPTFAVLIPGRCSPLNGCDDQEIGFAQTCLTDCRTNQAACQSLYNGVNAPGAALSLQFDEAWQAPVPNAATTINFLRNNCQTTLADCKSNRAACETVVRNTASGVPGNITCESPFFMRSHLESCGCEQQNSCSNFPWACGGGELDTADLFNDSTDNPNDFYRAVLNANVLATGTCEDPASPFHDFVRQSAVLAANQVAKFRQRAKFLRNRLEEARYMRDLLSESVTRLTNFLGVPVDRDDAWNSGAPARALTLALASDSAEAVGDLPYHAIYAWQTDPPKNPPRPAPHQNDGYWHIVRADIRIPKRCDNACGPNGGPDPKWPWVKTEMGFLGFRRCFVLKDDRGLIKAQVIRWDEERDTPGVFLPNLQEIWKFKVNHPSGLGAGFNADNIETQCPIRADIRDEDAPGAFILNHRIPNFLEDGSPAPLPNQNCWDLVNGLLKSGVVSETCAQYYFYFISDNHGGFNIKFVPCPD